MWNLKIMVQLNLFIKHKESQMYKTNLWLPRLKGVGINWEIGIDINTVLLLSHFSRIRLCATP